jgi:hypothetical protein
LAPGGAALAETGGFPDELHAGDADKSPETANNKRNRLKKAAGERGLKLLEKNKLNLTLTDFDLSQGFGYNRTQKVKESQDQNKEGWQ